MRWPWWCMPVINLSIHHSSNIHKYTHHGIAQLRQTTQLQLRGHHRPVHARAMGEGCLQYVCRSSSTCASFLKSWSRERRTLLTNIWSISSSTIFQWNALFSIYLNSSTGHQLGDNYQTRSWWSASCSQHTPHITTSPSWPADSFKERDRIGKDPCSPQETSTCHVVELRSKR